MTTKDNLVIQWNSNDGLWRIRLGSKIVKESYDKSEIEDWIDENYGHEDSTPVYLQWSID